MKARTGILLALLFFLLTPCYGYATTTTAKNTAPLPKAEVSVTSGIDFSKESQSTFDQSKTIAGTALWGTMLVIRVSTPDAEGTWQETATYDMDVGASGIFSQSILLSLGENTVEISAAKDGFDSTTQSTVVKRKSTSIKTELENSISIPGQPRLTGLFGK